jgi:PAS domain S-box-containing protein
MAAGRTLLIEKPVGQSAPLVLMVRPAVFTKHSQAYFVGEIKFDYLWSPDELDNLPIDTEYCVLGHTNALLYSSRPYLSDFFEAIKEDMNSAVSGHFNIAAGEEQYFASHTHVFLKPHFKLTHWNIILFKSKSDVFAPIADFKKVFPLIIILSFIIVIWLSSIYIRKNLVPLDALKAGVHRIAKKDFDYKVEIESGDELEELSSAFNQMSDQLRKKFSEMNLIADLGTKLTTILEVDDLAQTIIDSIRNNLDFDKGMFLLWDDEDKRIYFDESFGFSNQEIERIRGLSRKTNGEFNRHPVLKAFSSQKPVFVNPSVDSGVDHLFNGFNQQALVCIPIIYENRNLGMLLLAMKYIEGLTPGDDVEVLTGIASQAAVSLSNIDSFRRVQESEDRFRKTFEHSAGGMMLIKPDGRLIKTNSFLSGMLGYSSEELLTKSFSEIIRSNDHAKTFSSLQQMINGEIKNHSSEIQLLRKDGESEWVFTSISLFRDKVGEPLYFIALVQNISAQKEAQAEKRKLESQLQQSQKMEAIGTLAGGIAHDFNNILQAIASYTQISLNRAVNNEKLESNLKHILAASKRAAELVKQILTFSQRRDAEINPLSLSSILKESIKFFQATLPPNIEIIQNVSEKSAMIMGDPNQIHQVIMNLYTNAYQAILEKGSGVIKVDLSLEKNSPDGLMVYVNKRLIESKPSSCLKLSISDTGCGIAPDMIERIFEPYYTTKEKGKGTGLGLSVVHGIIKNHGGIINVESTLGEGTTFDIYFSMTGEKNIPESQATKEIPTGTESILVIDDELNITDTWEMMLKDLGYTVTCRNNPMEALEVFRKNPAMFDIVITDMAMPLMMGYELAAEIFKVRLDIPIICISGNPELIKNKPSVNPNFDGYLSKPVSFEKLAQTVRHTIDQSGKKRSKAVN